MQPTPVLRPPRPPHPTLPLAVAVGAVVLTATPLITSGWVVGWLDGFALPMPLHVALAVGFTYGPALLWWWVASGWLGTGHRRHDAGLIVRVADVWWGPITWLSCFVAQAVIGQLVLSSGIPFESNVDDLTGGGSDTQFVVTIIVLTVVIAPIAEEIVFRGLLMRGLLRVMPVGPAIALQAVLFGLAHVDPARGVGNIGLVVLLSSVGAVLGGAAYMHRRLAPAMIAHAMLNAIAVSLALWGPSFEWSMSIIR